MDVGAAACVDAVNKARAAARVSSSNFSQLGSECADFAVEGDNIEQIVFAQVVEHEFDRALGLLDLFPAHAAGAVDNEDDGFGNGFGVDRFYLWAGKHQKITVFVRLRPIADYTGGDRFFAGIEEQPEVVSGNRTLRFVFNDGVSPIGPLDVYRVGCGINVFDRSAAFDRQLNI